MKKLKGNVFFKMGVIILLILLLLIPTVMVQELIHERERVHKNAIAEVSDSWSSGQTLMGPFISIPYDKYVKRYSHKDSADKIVKVIEWIHFLPEQLDIGGTIIPEKRNRGIHEVVVYETSLNIQGSFSPLDFKQFEIESKNIHFDKAKLNLGISDLKGIETQIQLSWNDSTSLFNSGLSDNDIAHSGINAFVKLEDNDSSSYDFNMDIDLKGSQHLYFIPVGKTTNVNMESEWRTPSFTGNYLPDNRDVNTPECPGFCANWNVLHLNRNYPQSWIGANSSIAYSSFGTDLLLPVDLYKKSYRVARYAILFLVLTFLVFFFVEMLNGIFIHPMQYLLVGIAIVLFYTLLLSFSEHILFNMAYLLATILTLGLITFYTYAITKSKNVAFMISGILVILYLFIFAIIQLEDFALLIGSIGLFIILAVVMYVSRKIDWYNIRLGTKEE